MPTYNFTTEAFVNTPPIGSVTITGSITQGQVLIATNTLADVDGLGTISYQWKSEGTDISNATASTYVLTQAEVGKTITVVASYTDNKGTAESKTSASTAAVGALYEGSPLIGLIDGTQQDDIYIGTDLASAIKNLTVNDPGGNDTVIAENLLTTAGTANYFSSGIESSDFIFGNGKISFTSSINQGYYAKAIQGGSLVMGSGDSSVIVSTVEDFPGAFIYAATGIENWTLDAGDGIDTLDLTVTASRSQTFNSTGISGGHFNFGAGDDVANISITNESGSEESKGISGTTVELGTGDDSLTVNSTGYGVENCTIKAGEGNDSISITSHRDSVRNAQIETGDGNDTVVLNASGPNNVELFNTNINLGSGDDNLTLRFAINSTVDGGEGFDTLRLLDAERFYSTVKNADGSYEITRINNGFFKLNVKNIESIEFGSGVGTLCFTGSPLTGFLTGSAAENDTYFGFGLSAAIENLAVEDLSGNDRVVAQNLNAAGGFDTYFSTGILSSTFSFGDGNITFESKINQGYYATAISGGSLKMGSGDSFINVQATEDFPQERLGFYYSVTGISGWNLDAGAGADVLNVAVKGHKKETFNSYGINSGTYNFGEGNDIANITIVNESGTGESVGIQGVSKFDLGNGNNRLTVISTGYGIKQTTISSGDGHDVIDITANRDAIVDSRINTGEGDDTLFARCSGGNNTDLYNSSVNLGGGDDYVDLGVAINSTIDGGDGYDVLRLRDKESSYIIQHSSDGSVQITRQDNSFFNLTLNNVEIIIYGESATKPYYSGSPLTGFLTGTLAGNDTYYGSGLSAAIENLTVQDMNGNDHVVAENISASGWTESYFSSGILMSSFAFGDGDVNFESKINQGYYATAISGGSLTMGSGESYLNIQATEDFPEGRIGFVYAVTGTNDWSLDAGDGKDVLIINVNAHNSGTFESCAIKGGTYVFGGGSDVLSVNIVNGSGTHESIGILNASLVDFGTGDDLIAVFSSGQGIDHSTLIGGEGSDIFAVYSSLRSLASSSIDTGSGNDKIFLSAQDGYAELEGSSLQLGGGDDYVQITSGKNSSISGGDGLDTIRLLGAEQDYQFESKTDGSILISSQKYSCEILSIQTS